jgi:hypothetical protein
MCGLTSQTIRRLRLQLKDKQNRQRDFTGQPLLKLFWVIRNSLSRFIALFETTKCVANKFVLVQKDFSV